MFVMLVQLKNLCVVFSEDSVYVTLSSLRFGRNKKTYEVKLLTSMKYLTNSCMSVAS